MIVQVDGRTNFHHYSAYPDCNCGRSSRWYSGITKESHWYDTELKEEFSAKKFTCIFCLSNTEEGSPKAIALYDYQGNKHRFFEEISV